MASKRGDEVGSVDRIDADGIAGYCANVIADEARNRLKIRYNTATTKARTFGPEGLNKLNYRIYL